MGERGDSQEGVVLEEVTIKGKEVRELPVVLTEDEVNERGRALPVIMEEIDMIEDEKKNVVAEYGGRVKRKKAESEKLAREIRTEEKIVQVPCEWHYFWAQNVKKLIRTDTGQVLDQLAIQDFERQGHFPAVEGEALSGKDKAAGETEDE